MTDLDAVAEKEIAELGAQLARLAELRSANGAEIDQLSAGSLRHIARQIEIEAIDRSIRRLQGARAMWLLAKATRQEVSRRGSRSE